MDNISPNKRSTNYKIMPQRMIPMVLSSILMGIDIGTSNCKVALFTIDGDKICEKERKLGIISLSTGVFEQNPEELWNSVCLCISDVLKTSQVPADSIVAVGVTGHMPSSIPIDKYGNPLTNCILHLDTRTEPYVDEVLKKIPAQEVYSKTGIRPEAAYSAMKYLWLKAERPDIYKKTYKFLEPTSFIVFRLTNELFMDESHAAGTMLFNIHKRAWDTGLIRTLGIDSAKLPNVLPSISTAGEVSKEVETKIGIKKGIPVAVGAADSFSAAFGAGICGNNHILSDISGSTTCLNTITDKVILDKAMRFTCYPFIFPDKWILDATFTSGALVNAFLKILNIRTSNKNRYEWLDKALRNTRIGAGGLLFFPFVGTGEQSPYWGPRARSVLIGWEPGKKVEHIIRAIYEGMTYAIKLNVETFFDRNIPIHDVVASGGGAKSNAWCQMKADVLNLPVKVPKHVETSSLGAALIAGIAAKVLRNWKEKIEHIRKNYRSFLPDDVRHEKYMQFFRGFVKIYPAMKDIFLLLS